MSKSVLIVLLSLFIHQSVSAQNGNTLQKSPLIYNVYADAIKELNQTKARALKSKKNILIFVGGNWCIWCKRLNSYLNANDSLKSLMSEYEVLHINYSKENKNEKVLATLNNPQQYGFPVLVILDNKGKYLLTQNTGDLESGNSYDFDKVSTFLKQWTYKNLNHK